jgi:hypothetical protein
MSEEKEEKKHPTIAGMDAPQEEFIEQKAVPSKPEEGAEKPEKKEKPKP